jgi:acyl carrier protein phosphodiesterase
VNFLAHCLIAERAAKHLDYREADRDMLIAGGFIGDFLKGPVSDDLPQPLAVGVRLHRRIDAYSNQHEAIRRSCNRFPDALRRLAPPLVDVIADHLLATTWLHHHHQPLAQFSAETYRCIRDSDDYLPESGREFFVWMVENDLLASYQHWESAQRGMRSVTRRLRRSELNNQLADQLPALVDDLKLDFDDYFPDLQDHANSWLSAAPQSW